MIHFQLNIDNISDYQHGVLPPNAVRLDTPPTKDIIKKSAPIMAILCFLLQIPVFLRIFLCREFAVSIRSLAGIAVGFAAGYALQLVHELLHAAVYPKEAAVTVGKLRHKLFFIALASHPLSRPRFFLMCLLPFVLGIVPLVLFLTGAPEHDFLNWFFFGMAAIGTVSPAPDVYNVLTVRRQTRPTDSIQFYDDDIYRIPKEEAMAFDFKKEYKDIYSPKTKPAIIQITKMNYIAVRGKGDPNEEDGAYQKALSQLYGIAYTLKMSYKGTHKIEGFFEYVVPPLEGFWYQENVQGIDYARKNDFCWISVIRLPDFITRDDFAWAVSEATAKKKADFSAVEFLTVDEGLCVQCMHIGSYDDEPATVALMHQFAAEQGYQTDFTAQRLHHEIYLSDPRKTEAAKLKTVIRHPLRPL